MVRVNAWCVIVSICVWVSADCTVCVCLCVYEREKRESGVGVYKAVCLYLNICAYLLSGEA